MTGFGRDGGPGISGAADPGSDNMHAMPDKSAHDHEAPLAQLLAIGTKAESISKLISRGDLTQLNLQHTLHVLSGLLIELTSVVVQVYGEQKLALIRAQETV